MPTPEAGSDAAASAGEKPAGAWRPWLRRGPVGSSRVPPASLRRTARYRPGCPRRRLGEGGEASPMVESSPAAK